MQHFRSTCTNQDDSEEEAIESDYMPTSDDEETDASFYMPYLSPERNITKRRDALPNLFWENISPQAYAICQDHIEDLTAMSSLREQICSVVSLLGPEDSQPLASWAEIGSIFKLTKGAVERHYSRGVEEGSGGKNAILDEEWHQFRYGKLSYE